MAKKSRVELEQMNMWQIRDYANKLGCPEGGFANKSALVEFCLGASDTQQSDMKEVKRGRGRPRKEQTDGILTLEETSTLPVKKVEKPAEDPRKQEQKFPQSKKHYSPLYEGGRNNNRNDRQNNNSNYADGQKNKQNRQPYNRDIRDRQNQNSSEPTSQEEFAVREGVLEICADGYGFLRAVNYENGGSDAYISNKIIKNNFLRKGDYIVATAKKVEENKPWGVQEVQSVNGESPDKARNRPRFEDLTPIHPDSRLKLEIESVKSDFAVRAMDLVSPIGKGQRGMIVSPPKAGKTTLLKTVAKSISTNYPEAQLMVLLIDERPEEVTDMQRSIKGEVVYSTFDEMPDHHIKVTELVLERAKRMVEMGKDVIILLDSLTRLTRAYNLVISPTGKILSGGIDPGAFYGPKKFFGAARNIENGGSLTILATALVDTGSRMDDVVYEEFKGTGNMEVHLDRKLAERRIFPAIDLYRSGTRREELLLNKEELECAIIIRNMMSSGDNADATENLVGKIFKSRNNKELYQMISLEKYQMEKQGYKMILN